MVIWHRFCMRQPGRLLSPAHAMHRRAEASGKGNQRTLLQPRDFCRLWSVRERRTRARTVQNTNTCDMFRRGPSKKAKGTKLSVNFCLSTSPGAGGEERRVMRVCMTCPAMPRSPRVTGNISALQLKWIWRLATTKENVHMKTTDVSDSGSRPTVEHDGNEARIPRSTMGHNVRPPPKVPTQRGH